MVNPSEAVKILYGENQPIKVKVESSDIEVKNLEDLLNIVELASTEDVYQHVRRGGLARWLYVIGDKPLSREINRLRNAVTRFNVKDMLKKILEHELVPKHEIASPEEAARVLKQYGIKPEELPWIRASDPVVRAIGARPGDIIKIVRKSPTAGEIVVYRYVVPG